MTIGGVHSGVRRQLGNAPAFDVGASLIALVGEDARQDDAGDSTGSAVVGAP